MSSGDTSIRARVRRAFVRALLVLDDYMHLLIDNELLNKLSPPFVRRLVRRLDRFMQGIVGCAVPIKQVAEQEKLVQEMG